MQTEKNQEDNGIYLEGAQGDALENAGRVTGSEYCSLRISETLGCGRAFPLLDFPSSAKPLAQHPCRWPSASTGLPRTGVWHLTGIHSISS